MTKENSKHLVVVSVIEGRRFPKRAKHKIIVEARFDGELLTTDPVDHTESPDFTQELAWEVDRKSLQQHRLQRTSIKVQCYATDVTGTVKEQIGYVVLDLRVAQPKQINKWFPLLNSKYTKSKPDICLGLYLDDDKSDSKVQSTADTDVHSFSVSDYRTPPHASKMRPQLDEAQGLYQIGPPTSCTDQFILSITIAFANNLGQLIPSSVSLPSSSYFFYYSLLGNDVTNEVFHDLLNPTFPVERSSVKIRSSVDVLREFFTNQPGVQVHLCCGDQSLGSCEVPLNGLLKPSSTEIYMQPVSCEGTYRLVPPNKVKQQLPPFTGDTAPVVGITVVLKKEDSVLTVKSGKDDLDGSYLSISPDKKSRPKKDKKSVTIAADGKGEDARAYTNGVEGDDQGDANHAIISNANVETEKPVQKHPEIVQDAVHKPRSQIGSVSQSRLVTPPIDIQPNHFTFAVDLRSIRDISQHSTYNIFLRYMYPFFGSAVPINTHPPTAAAPGQELLLPQSFCAFDFACTAHQLHETFTRVPLLVEMWHKDVALGKDQLLGTTQLPLSLILTAEKTRLMSNGETGMRQVHSDRLPLHSVDSTVGTCGELTFVLSLEDWGPIDTKQLPAPAVPLHENNVAAAKRDDAEDGANAARVSAEYQAAIELELWKETQEQIFEKQMKQKESLYMKALADEWKKRDREREIIIKKKVAEYTQLEEELRKTIADLEKRDKRLYTNEQEVARLRKDLQHEHERKLQEMREASRRLKDDCDHRISLERSKIADLEATITRHKNETQDAIRKYEALERDFEVHKQQQNNTPQVKLQSEINLLTLEKVELDRKLDAAIKSKVHYKQQWGRALKELERLRQKEQDTAKAQLKKQQEELEQMRLRYLAAEEKEVIGDERKELEEIKNELNRLRIIEEQKNAEVREMEEKLKSAGGDATNSPSTVVCNDIDNTRLTRLIEERDTLLRTGVYTMHDPIIAMLEKQIREYIASHTS